MTTVVIVVAIVVVVAVVAWMWLTRRVPERAASHGAEPARRRETDDLAGGVDRPADPSAEAQGPVVGDAAPGPPGPPA
jgi:hypothetical protein